ncbi:MAG TPA: hypothetical protein VJA94_25560 [Candidatus Angelobacter sp.]
MKTPAYLLRYAAIVAVTLALCMAVPFAGAGSAGQTDRDIGALRDFNSRIEQYMTIHRRADTLVPHIQPTSSAKKIIDRRHALAAEIAKQRGATREANIFTPEIDAYFGRLIHAAYQQNARGIETTLECTCPVNEEELKPNDVYPEGAEYMVMPSTILLHVPELPPELEYRIVNKDLIIRDREANLIVDILRNAVVPPAGRKLCED